MKVWVNGTFDVLHRGHFELLTFAAKFGTLRVGIDLDDRVKQLKGLDRPVNSFNDRVYAMASIKGVDSVVGFGTDDGLRQCIKNWAPDVMVVGSDYKDKIVIGSEFAGEVVFFDRIDGYSSTNIINHADHSSR